MCTYKDRFPEYKKIVLRVINSCENPVQLLCAFDMIDRFIEVFKLTSIEPRDMAEAVDDLYTEYNAKQAAINIS